MSVVACQTFKLRKGMTIRLYRLFPLSASATIGNQLALNVRLRVPFCVTRDPITRFYLRIIQVKYEACLITFKCDRCRGAGLPGFSTSFSSIRAFLPRLEQLLLGSLHCGIRVATQGG